LESNFTSANVLSVQGTEDSGTLTLMNYATVLKAGDPKMAARRQHALAVAASILPHTETHPPVTDDQELDDESSRLLKKRRSEAAVYATAQEGTIAGFPAQPPNY
jgi:hypothetical protein